MRRPGRDVGMPATDVPATPPDAPEVAQDPAPGGTTRLPLRSGLEARAVKDTVARTVLDRLAEASIPSPQRSMT